MVTSNFSLLLSCLLMCVFIFNGRPAWVPHSSAASPAGGEELAWLEGAAKSRRSILFWVTGSREVSSWPEVVIYLVAWQLLGVRSGYPAASQSFMDELSGSAALGEIPATSTGWRQVIFLHLGRVRASEWRPTTGVMCRKAQCSIAPWAGICQGQNENHSPRFRQEHYKWWGKQTGSYLSFTQIKLPLKSEAG